MATTTRYSPKREAILKNVKSRCDHPTAAMVYDAIRELYPDISLGTVYRNLGGLVSDGRLISFQSEGIERFDGDITPHLHYCCEVCKGIYDIAADGGLCDRLPAPEGFSIEGIKIIINGRCKNCL